MYNNKKNKDTKHKKGPRTGQTQERPHVLAKCAALYETILDRFVTSQNVHSHALAGQGPSEASKLSPHLKTKTSCPCLLRQPKSRGRAVKGRMKGGRLLKPSKDDEGFEVRTKAH